MSLIDSEKVSVKGNFRLLSFLTLSGPFMISVDHFLGLPGGGGEAGQGKDRHILPHCGPMVKRALQTVCMYTMRQDRTKILMFSLIVTLWSHVPCKPFV